MCIANTDNYKLCYLHRTSEYFCLKLYCIKEHILHGSHCLNNYCFPYNFCIIIPYYSFINGKISMHTMYACWQSFIIEKGWLEGFKNKCYYRNLDAIKKNAKNSHCRRKTVKEKIITRSFQIINDSCNELTILSFYNNWHWKCN